MKNARIINTENGRFCAFCGQQLPMPTLEICICSYAQMYDGLVKKVELLDQLADKRSEVAVAQQRIIRFTAEEQEAIKELKELKDIVNGTILCPE